MRRPSAATEDERVCNRNSKSWRRGGAKWRDRCGPDGRHDATNPTLQLAASRSGCCAATADNSRAGLEGWRAAAKSTEAASGEAGGLHAAARSGIENLPHRSARTVHLRLHAGRCARGQPVTRAHAPTYSVYTLHCTKLGFLPGCSVLLK